MVSTAERLHSAREWDNGLMTKSELIHRIAHKQPLLVERDVTLAVRVMFEQMAARLAGGGRIEIRGWGAGVASGQVRALFQAGQEGARAR